MTPIADIAVSGEINAPLPPGPRAMLAAVLPGLALAGGVAGAAYVLRLLPSLAGLSPMIIAIALGIAVRNTVGRPVAAGAGITFAMRRLLRLAIILLGLQLTAAQVVATGAAGVAILAAGVVATFVLTRALGRLMGVPAALTDLIAAGTSICGASAVVAANSVARGSDADVTYAVACVTVFGSVAMLVDPVLGRLLDLTPLHYGLWVGASIHEIAQVVAAAFAAGPQSGEIATVSKLARVVMLAPMVLAMAAIAVRARNGRGQGGQGAGEQAVERPPLPWFVLGFVALVALNSAIEIPTAIRADAAIISTALLTVALAAMGLETDIAKLRARGFRPLALGAIASVFISAFTLLLIALFV